MKKYKVLQAPADPAALEKPLNDQAAQGWELVTHTPAGLVFVSINSVISTNVTKQKESMIGINKDELTTGQAAKLAGCALQTIKNHIHKGTLKATFRAGKYAIKKADFEAWKIEIGI